MMHRSEAQSFLNIMRYVKATPDEFKMADNFFAILKNKVPEVWFDQGFELGGGQAFTVGSEGDERNKNYTVWYHNHYPDAASAYNPRCSCGQHDI